MRTAKFILLSLTVLACLILTLYIIWPREHVEIQVRQTKWSPEGEWAAVVQLEVHSIWIVSSASHTIRLKGPGQKSTEGDMVMSVPASSAPEPSIEWRNGALVITLPDDERYEYFCNPVDGVAAIVEQNRNLQIQDRRTPGAIQGQ